MSRDNVRAIHETLTGLPLHDRLAALVISVLEGESRAPMAIGTLIAVASILARHLPPSQRAAIAWHLSAAAEEIDAQWN
jgi:hypothetical protein